MLTFMKKSFELTLVLMRLVSKLTLEGLQTESKEQGAQTDSEDLETTGETEKKLKYSTGAKMHTA
jgi:hypothetical protein